MKIRLTYLTSARIPDEWAHVIQILKMCEAFADSGAEVRLVAPNRGATKRESPYAFAGVKENFSVTKLPCIDLFPGTKSGLLFWVRTISFFVSAWAYLLLARTDIVFTRDPLLVLAARCAGASNVTWEVHTANWTLFARLAAKGAHTIISISGGLAEFYIGKGVNRKKIEIEHDGVNAKEFYVSESREAVRAELGIPVDSFVIEYVGKFKTMGESKGVEEIIDMAGMLVKQYPNILLLIVGLYESEIKEVQGLVESAGLIASQFQLVAHVPHSRVPEYLYAADVLLMNYPNTPHYAHIMSPLKVFEYMATGVPVVSSDLPTIREVLGDDTAFLVSPGDIQALLGGVEEVIKSPDEAKHRAQKARTEVEKYSWTKRAARILERI